jgi:hypothetical protein
MYQFVCVTVQKWHSAKQSARLVLDFICMGDSGTPKIELYSNSQLYDGDTHRSRRAPARDADGGLREAR